jgi:hypothetical protein
MNTFLRIISNPEKYLSFNHIFNNSIGDRLFNILLKTSRWFPYDVLYIKLFYRLGMKQKLNFENPSTYTQKIQWLKLHNTDAQFSMLVDKYAVKNYIKQIIGEQYVIPLLGVWNNYDEIDFNALPDQFVLKTNHDSGTVIVCTDKSKLNHDSARKKLNKALSVNYFYKSREYPYKNIKPRIIAEEYIHDSDQGELTDYKIFCFHGEPYYLQITSNNGVHKYMNYFDTKFQPIHLSTGLPVNPHGIEEPENIDKMLEIARLLSKNIIHVRVDMYNIGGKIYFGEYTFHNSGGIIKFNPQYWDEVWGNLI